MTVETFAASGRATGRKRRFPERNSPAAGRTWIAIGTLMLGGLLAATPGGVAGPPAGVAWAKESGQLAFTVPRRPHDADLDLPRVLGNADARRYHDIFELQESSRWAKADRLIRRLDDRVLMGHVLAQRYLHPTGWRSTYKELRDWLAAYADQPDAQRIHTLAMKRRPRGWKAPKRPTGRILSGTGGDGGRDQIYRSGERKSAKQRRLARNYRIGIRSRIRSGWPTGAVRLLSQRAARTAFDAVERDQLLGRISQSYLNHGKNAKAYKVAARAAKRSGAYLPHPSWIAGLAAFRREDYTAARRHFEATTRATLAGDWTRSRGAYWASRAALRGGEPTLVSKWLREAAQQPRTFYGVLAMRALSVHYGFNWELPPLQQHDLRDLKAVPAGRRALALLQIGIDERAEGELRRVYARGTPAQRRALLALASRTGMPSLALRLGTILRRQDDVLMHAVLYPLPHWEPHHGFQVDRALLYALIRQESAFNPRARSHVGARGLMQVMPATARFVAKNEGLGRVTRSRMYDPEFNLELGQRYIQHLLGHFGIGDSLFHMVASYNAGPGNVLKWNDRVAEFDDPLMFIESFSASETLDFVERVLTNFWMYRQHLGQPTPSLDAIVSGQWPRYMPLDNRQTARLPGDLRGSVQHGDNR